MYSWQMVFAKNDAEYDSLYNDMMSMATGLGLEEAHAWALKAWAEASALADEYT